MSWLLSHKPKIIRWQSAVKGWWYIKIYSVVRVQCSVTNSIMCVTVNSRVHRALLSAEKKLDYLVLAVFSDVFRQRALLSISHHHAATAGERSLLLLIA